jgi:hypothetical protein
MAEELSITPTYFEHLGPGPYQGTICEACKKATGRKLFRSVAMTVEICDPHLAELKRFSEQHPERLITFDTGSRKFYWTNTVLPNDEDPKTPGGDMDPGQQQFARAVLRSFSLDKLYPFSVGQLVRLVLHRTSETRELRHRVVIETDPTWRIPS